MDILSLMYYISFPIFFHSTISIYLFHFHRIQITPLSLSLFLPNRMLFSYLSENTANCVETCPILIELPLTISGISRLPDNHRLVSFPLSPKIHSKDEPIIDSHLYLFGKPKRELLTSGLSARPQKHRPRW